VSTKGALQRREVLQSKNRQNRHWKSEWNSALDDTKFTAKEKKSSEREILVMEDELEKVAKGRNSLPGALKAGLQSGVEARIPRITAISLFCRGRKTDAIRKYTNIFIVEKDRKGRCISLPVFNGPELAHGLNRESDTVLFLSRREGVRNPAKMLRHKAK
jgi:hypothetical protein